MTETAHPLRVHQLYAENFKRLRIVDIRPDPDEPIILLTGKNRQGKTSVIEVIWSLLLGQKFIPDAPIRKGAEKAKGFIDFGEYTVSRTFTKAGGTLTVKAKDGFKAPSPQEFLSSKVGSLIHNPLEFMKLGAPKQVEILQGLVNLQVNLEEFGKVSGFKVSEVPPDPLGLFDSAFDNLTERRKTVNAEVKRLEGVVKSIALPENWQEIQPVSVIELFEERNKLLEEQTRQTSIKNSLPPKLARLKQTEEMIQAHDRRIEELIQERARVEGLKSDLVMERAKLNQEIGGLEDQIGLLVPPDFTDIDARITTADETNSKAADIKRHQEGLANLKEQREASEEFTRRLDAIKEYKGKLVAEAGMPVAGLGFANGVVTFNDLPLSVASGAEQIHVSCAVCMASHPEIGLLTIDVGWSELDKESQHTLREWAKEMGVHVICTRVSEDPEAEGWHIFDGEVIAINGEAPPAVEPVKEDGKDSGPALEDAPKQDMPSFMMEEEELNRGPHLPGANLSGSLPKRLAKSKSAKEEN